MITLGRTSYRRGGNDVIKESLTHRFAADIHLHFISSALCGALFHAYEAMFLLTQAIYPVPILQKKKHYTGYTELFFYSS